MPYLESDHIEETDDLWNGKTRRDTSDVQHEKVTRKESILHFSISLTSRSLLLGGRRDPRCRRRGDGDDGRREGDEREEVVHRPRPD